MKKKLNPKNAELFVTLNKQKRVAVLHIAFDEGEISYDLTPEQAEQLGMGLLKIYGHFSGKGSLMTIWSGKEQK